ncbi:amidohydrolase [candidate division KSB1 bacterium]|nr:MAG: amidohydrolase [candidate division KSB1 bacterium]
MNIPVKDIINETEKILPEIIKIRRWLHRHPELSKQEFNTAKYISEYLKKLGIEHKTRIAKTGIVGLIPAPGDGKTVALRTDMDALPVMEQTGLPYSSENKGVMHACGHDIHISCLLGTATILKKFQDKLRCNVKLLFQPSEETLPGGAISMIKEGVLKNPDVDAIFGLHTDPDLPVGTIGVKKGPMMASANNFQIKIIGKGGHGAHPHLTKDPILTAAEVVLALQKVVSRMTNPFSPAVLSFGTISGGSASNIIPEEVEIVGTCRALDQETADLFPQAISRIVKGVTEGNGCTYKYRYIKGTPVLINEPVMTELVKKAASEIIGNDNVIPIVGTMGGEDFAYFLQETRGSFFKLGVGKKDKIEYYLHSPFYIPDENSIKYGILTLVNIINHFSDEKD